MVAAARSQSRLGRAQISGILENSIGFLIPNEEEPLWHRAKNCLDYIPVPQRHFFDVDVPKAYIHTWLAWQEEPGMQLGLAVTAEYLNIESYVLRNTQ